MNIFDQHIIFLEAKEKLINAMPWTDEQKKEIQELVNKYPQKASKIDWNNKELDAEEVLGVLREESKKLIKKQVRQGIPGLKENYDYIEITGIKSKYPDSRFFVPITFKGSCAIGRGSKWCTTSEKEPQHWRNYIRNGKTFIYVLTPNIEDKVYSYVALVFGKNGNYEGAFDKNDAALRSTQLIIDNLGIDPTQLSPYIEKAHEKAKKENQKEFEKIIKGIPKFLESKTHVVLKPENTDQLEALSVDENWSDSDVGIDDFIVIEKSTQEKYLITNDALCYNGSGDRENIDSVIDRSGVSIQMWNYFFEKFKTEIASQIKRHNKEIKIEIKESSIKLSGYLDSFADHFGDKWEFVNDFVNGGGFDFFDFDVSWREIELSDISDKNINKIKTIIKDKYGKDFDIEEYDYDELKELIKQDFDEIKDSILSAYRDGYRSGAEGECYKDIRNAITDSGWKEEIDGQFTYTFDNAHGGITSLALMWSGGFDLLFQDNDDYAIDEDTKIFKIELDEPHYGWSGFDEEGMNERLSEMLDEYMPDTDEEKMKKEGQKELFDEKGKPTPEAKRPSKNKKKQVSESNIFDHFLKMMGEDVVKDKKQEKVKKVMREFKRRKLKSSSGEIVTNRKQAVAIALSEAGLSKKKY